eukprot:scaffold104841_cov29-Tisochrysis_lutea.AAC.4
MRGRQHAGDSTRACRARPINPACMLPHAVSRNPPRINNHKGVRWQVCVRTASSEAVIATRGSCWQAPKWQPRPTPTDLKCPTTDS